MVLLPVLRFNRPARPAGAERGHVATTRVNRRSVGYSGLRARRVMRIPSTGERGLHHRCPAIARRGVGS